MGKKKVEIVEILVKGQEGYIELYQYLADSVRSMQGVVSMTGHGEMKRKKIDGEKAYRITLRLDKERRREPSE